MLVKVYNKTERERFIAKILEDYSEIRKQMKVIKIIVKCDTVDKYDEGNEVMIIKSDRFYIETLKGEFFADIL